MRVTVVLSLAPMRLSVSWKLHDAFIRNEFLPFLWGLLSSNVYTSPLLPSVFGDLDLQHLLVDWIDAKWTNPLKKRKIESSCAKQRRWCLAFQRPLGKLEGNTTARCPAGFAFLIWFSLTLGNPHDSVWRCFHWTSLQQSWGVSEQALHCCSINSSVPLTASGPIALHIMMLQRRCNWC